MKIRNGFVSNSSSSSFICNVCGEDASGWDICLSEAEMTECVNGHTFCDNHMLDVNRKEICISILKDTIKIYEKSVKNHPDDKYYKEYLEMYNTHLSKIDTYNDDEIEELLEDDNIDFRYNAPDICCPLCQLQKITDNDALNYLLSKDNMTVDDVLKEIKEKYKTYNKFKEDIKC